MKHQTIRPWSRGRVIQEIRALRRTGEPLNGQRMIRHQTLYGHARRLFGSWEKAVRACGLDYDQIVLRRLWTKEAILAWIRTEWRQKHDIRPGVAKKRHSGVFNAALREFGSWYGAIRKAGIRSFPEVKFQRWSKERVIGAIATMRAVPSPKDILLENAKLERAAAYYFGSWTRAVRAADRECPVGRKPTKWTRERILEIITERLSAGRGPQSTAFKDLGAFVRAASMHFVGWRNAVKAAGFDVGSLGPSRYVWSRNEVLRVIRHRGKMGQSNEALAAEEDHPGLTAAGRFRFGSWPAAVRAAGCSLSDPSKWTRDTICAHLRKHSSEGFAPRASELGRAFRAAVGQLFGSWKHAALEAELRVRPQRRKWTKDRVVKAVKRRVLRGLPLSRDPRLIQAVLRVFGGAHAAIKAAGLSPARAAARPRVPGRAP